MISMARCLGAPVTEPPGNVARNSAARPTSARTADHAVLAATLLGRARRPPRLRVGGGVVAAAARPLDGPGLDAAMSVGAQETLRRVADDGASAVGGDQPQPVRRRRARTQQRG